MQRGQQLPLRGTLLLAAGLIAGGARADTVFDFSAPGADQEGVYAAADGATLEAGAATLGLGRAPAWAAPGARYRVTLRVAAAAPRSGHPLRVDLAAAPDELFRSARGDGRDLRLFDDAGTELGVWLERYDWIAAVGAFCFRPATLAGGTNTFVLYFGDPEHEAAGDPDALFRHDPPAEALWVVDDLTPAGDIAVAALDDATRVVAGTTDVVLAARETLALPAGTLGLGHAVAVGGPVGAMGTVEAADALTPLALASATLLAITPRFADRFCLAAPFGPAAVEIRSGTASLAATSLAAGETRCLDADGADFAGIAILADAPVLAFHYSTNAGTHYDGYNVVAPATELLGGNAGTGRVAALEDGTTIQVHLSDGTSSTITLDAGAGAALPSPGTQGSGPAVRLVADRPIAAISYGDGDGGEAIPFLPPSLLGERFVVPLAAQYVLVAADRPGTECVLLAPDGTEADRQRGDTLAPPFPGRLFFGTAGAGSPIAAGSEIACDGPVGAVAEDGTTQDEKTLWPVQLFRPVVLPEPTASFGAVETRHAAGTGTVITPTYRPRWGVRTWLSFAEAGSTTVPWGTSLRYQISIDDGASWLVPDVGGWRAAATGEGAEPWDVDAAIGTLPAGPVGLAVRALLGSDDGTEAPVLDELRIVDETVGDPAAIVFGPIGSPQVAGRPFGLTLTLVDSLGDRVTTYDGTATLEATAGTVAPAASGPFVGGMAAASITVDRAATGVRLRAAAAGVTGESGPFDVLPGDAALLTIAGGDGQFGPAGRPLPEPVRVRLTDAVGNPLSAVSVAFAVSRGGGSVDPTNALTGADGIAAASWTVGEGANILQASLPGRTDVAPVELAARGDTESVPTDGEGDGCGCRAAGDPTPAAAAVLLLPALLLRRRRRR